MKISSFEIGKDRTFIVAEIGNNHGGDVETAKRMIEAAATCSVDAVKFQTFRTECLISMGARTYDHAKGSHKSQFERFKSFEFSPGHWQELARTSEDQGLIFMTSVFDPESSDIMEPLVSAFKIASGDIDNVPLLRHVKGKNKPIIISTGCSNMKEIERTVMMLDPDNLAVLHCIATYPVERAEDMNLRSIPFMRKALSIPVGYSDHTIGAVTCLGAVALGAAIIEKHFTLDKNISGGDHRLSADPDDMKELVKGIRWLEASVGKFEKQVAECEANMKPVIRRGLYAARSLSAGESISEKDVIPLRPMEGVSVSETDTALGLKTKRDISKGEAIFLDDLE
ncbi:N-acetylneuraminate synthase family protein [Thermodesulfobacteriota bacterium]